jgi:hypothetical protein
VHRYALYREESFHPVSFSTALKECSPSLPFLLPPSLSTLLSVSLPFSPSTTTLSSLLSELCRCDSWWCYCGSHCDFGLHWRCVVLPSDGSEGHRGSQRSLIFRQVHRSPTREEKKQKIKISNNSVFEKKLTKYGKTEV